MSTHHGAAWSTDPDHDLEAIPTRIARPEADDELEALPTRIARPEADDELLPTQIAHAPGEEAKTTQVDISDLPPAVYDDDDDEMISGTRTRFFVAPAERRAPTREEAAEYEARETPEEYLQTKFIDGRISRGDEADEATHDAPAHGAPAHDAPLGPASETPECAPALEMDPATTTHQLPKHRRGGGRGIILAATIVGLAVLGGGVAFAVLSPPAETPRLPRHVSPAAAPVTPGAIVTTTQVTETPAEPSPEPVAAEPTEEAPDHLAEAARALTADDLEATAAAIEAARGAGTDETEIARLAAQLAVQRGDGALAIEDVRALCESHGLADDWVALGQLLVQAERDAEAREAFTEALALDSGSAHARIGLVGVHARAADLTDARDELARVQALVEEQPGVDPVLAARLKTAEAFVLLESGASGLAQREAEHARSLDARSAEAALLLARIDYQEGRDPESHLREAVRGRAPAPMALGMLGRRADGDEACELAARYLERAPAGFDADAMRRVSRSCPTGV